MKVICSWASVVTYVLSKHNFDISSEMNLINIHFFWFWQTDFMHVLAWKIFNVESNIMFPFYLETDITHLLHKSTSFCVKYCLFNIN